MLFTYNETDNVTFTCTAVGIPAPDILFFRGALRLNGTGMEAPNPRVLLENPTSPVVNSDSGEDLLQVSRTLVITDTEDGDSGNYSCQTVSDSMLEVDTVTFELLVQGQIVHLSRNWMPALCWVCTSPVYHNQTTASLSVSSHNVLYWDGWLCTTVK